MTTTAVDERLYTHVYAKGFDHACVIPGLFQEYLLGFIRMDRLLLTRHAFMAEFSLLS